MKRIRPSNASSDLRWVSEHLRWPNFGWDAAAVSGRLGGTRRAQGELVGTTRLLDVDSQTRADADLLLQDALHTSSIEGEHPYPAGVRSSIARRLGLPYAGLPTPERGWTGWGLEKARGLAMDGEDEITDEGESADIGAAFLAYFSSLRTRSRSPEAKYAGQL